MKDGILLSVSELKVKFDNHVVLNNISFNVKRDETLAIIGPNGAGKTVLFRCLLNLISYKGEIKWATDVRIGYVPQKLSVARDLPLTVSEFLNFKENSLEKVNQALTKVGFKVKAKHLHHDLRVLRTRLGSLSGGELQRILMAYALLGKPNVLLLDEPTAGVDLTGEKTFYGLFKELKKDNDLTIIFISHDRGVVDQYADEVIHLSHDH